MGYIVHGNLSVDAELLSFINDTLLPSAGVEADRFWAGFDEAVHRLAPRNAELLQIREEMQSKIDSWLVDHRDSPFDDAAYTDFLREIGYVVEDGEDFVIATENVDISALGLYTLGELRKSLDKNKNVTFILTTHYLDLCKILQQESNVKNLQMQVELDNKDFIYTYKIIEGISKIKGGIKVLNDLKYPDEILDECNKLLQNSINTFI